MKSGFSNFTIYEGGHIIIILYREVVDIEINLISVDFFWKLINKALVLDSFSLSEFVLHQLYNVPKHWRRSEHVKGSFGLLVLASQIYSKLWILIWKSFSA